MSFNKIWVWLTSILGVLVLTLRGSLWKERAKTSEDKANREFVARKTSDAATEALIQGIQNEAKNGDSRKHNFRD